MSWSWSQILGEALADGDTMTLLTPGYDQSQADLTKAELAVDNKVMVVGTDATVNLSDPSAALITNTTGGDWAAGASVYLMVPRKVITPTSNEARISTLETQVADLETRVTALENP